MITAELALTKTFLDILVGTDAYERSRVIVDLGNVLLDIDDEEAPVVTSAFSAALVAVSSDLPRWRLAAEAAVLLDMYEVLEGLVSGLAHLSDPHQVGLAATLLSNPSVGPDRRARYAAQLSRVVSSDRVRQLLELRLGHVPPRDASDQILHAQVWPGHHSAADLGRFAPIVYVASEGAPPRTYWRTIGALAVAGARIRRFDSVGLVNPAWANEFSPIVHWSGKALAAWRAAVPKSGRTVMAPEELDTQLAGPRLVSQVALALPPGWHLRPMVEEVHATPLSSPFTDEALRDGSFDNLEMMYLGAAGRSTLQQLARDVLAPRGTDRLRWWTFDQLVTLRLVQSFKVHRHGRADASKVFERIHDIALAAATSDVAFDANGNLYVDQGEGFRTIDGDQEALGDVLKVDEAFRPFKLGGGAVPDLLNPSNRTSVDPRVLGGTPTIRGRRLSARAVHDVFLTRGQDAMRSAFPEIEVVELQDAIKVGRGITANRRV